MNHKINWEISNLIPKFLKKHISEKYIKANFLKESLIVAMLRNYTTNNLKTNKISNSIILNKNLIIKPIDTKNLTTTFINSIDQENFTENYDVEVYKIVIHINNSFNPTNIGLFDKENNIHFYRIQGDKTLHVNIGLLTFFNILSNQLIEFKKRKPKLEEKQYKPYNLNSNLSYLIEKLLKTSIITLYSFDSNNEIIWDSEYYLYSKEENPLKFTYDSIKNRYWRYDLRDIPLFIHNLWWDAILTLFKIYDIKLWKSPNKVERSSNSNNFRLKIIILQLLGGLSKLNMLEKQDKFNKDNYVINSSNFESINTFEKELLKDIQDTIYLNKLLGNLMVNVNSQFTLSDNVVSGLKSILIEEQQDELDFSFDDLDLLKNKNKKIWQNLLQ